MRAMATMFKIISILGVGLLLFLLGISEASSTLIIGKISGNWEGAKPQFLHSNQIIQNFGYRNEKDNFYTLVIFNPNGQEVKSIKVSCADGNGFYNFSTQSGKYIITSTTCNSKAAHAQVIDIETGRVIHYLQGGVTSLLLAMAVSPNGRYAATGYLGGNIAYFDLETGAKLGGFWVTRTGLPIRGLAFSPQSDDIAVSVGSNVRVFYSNGGFFAPVSRDSNLAKLDFNVLDRFQRVFTSISYRYDGKLLAVGCNCSTGYVYYAGLQPDVRNKFSNIRKTFYVPNAQVVGVRFHPKRDLVVVNSSNKIWFYEGENYTKKTLLPFQGTLASFSPDGTLMAIVNKKELIIARVP
jgi:WD40 repeat protein